MSTVACSSGTTGGYGGPAEDSGLPPSPSATATGTSNPKDPPDAAAPKPDASTDPQVDKTVRFALTLDGESVTVTTTKVKVEPASGTAPASIVIDGSYEQGSGAFTSTATLTIRVGATTKGTDACGTGGRSVFYWFKDTDGAIRGLGTMFQGGACTLNATANEKDGFTSGTATGIVGGAKMKPFSVTWGQPIPK